MTTQNSLYRIFNPNNSFFNLAKDAKRLPHIGFSSLLLPLLFIGIGGVIVQFILFPLIIGDPKEASSFTKNTFVLFTLFSLVIVVVWLWVKYVEGRPFSSIGLIREKVLMKYFFGFSTGAIMISTTVGLMALAGCIEIQAENVVPTGLNSLGAVSVLLIAYIIQGGCEEVVSRGWQFQVIGTRYSPWLGALISSLLFAMLHAPNPGVTVLAIVNLFLFAALMILYVLNDGSIWSACGWHSAWNWAQGNVFGLEVSGTALDGGSIWDLQAVGPNFLSGGNFGPEGSIMTTVVLLSGIIVMLFYKRNEWIA